jgi:hypothetical protein
MTNPTAEPAAKTVFAHRTFSTVSGSTLGTSGTSDSVGAVRLIENVPINV